MTLQKWRFEVPFGATCVVSRCCAGCGCGARGTSRPGHSEAVRTPFPDDFTGRPFSRREAVAAGIKDSRLRSAKLAHPFHGVRALDWDASYEAHIRAYHERMPRTQHFSHGTAALLHGFPVPSFATSALHVSAVRTAGFPRAHGVVGHHSDSRVVTLGRMRVSHPVDTWCDLATVLAVDDLVAIGDFLITGDEPYSGVPPIARLSELEHAVRLRAGRRGTPKLWAALELVRYGPLSRMETEMRLLIVRDHLPEPALNFRVLDSNGVFVAMVDLAFDAWKVAVEYQGDLHREKKRFRADITRRERLEDAGWTVIFVSVDDIRRQPSETLRRIRRRLRDRGAPL